MAEYIEITTVGPAAGPARYDECFTEAEAEKAKRFHEGLPGYSVTPLADLKGLAKKLGLKGIYVKDESKRFGLNAFKGLGGSYAVATRVSEVLGLSEVSYEALRAPEGRDRIAEMTFITATDGNHGRSVAWTASLLGALAVIYMPKGSSAERLENIRKLGAKADITDMNYDDTVRFALKTAEENGWHYIQDTAWDGYEEVPTKIMQGYTTMALEAARQLGDTVPTHVFLQAGVGAMAGAVTGFLANFYGGRKPLITIVEPSAADCIFRTADAKDGALHNVSGDLGTMMAGLACGEPCTIGWDQIEHHAGFAAHEPDSVAALGMRTLAYPSDGDPAVESGESGAATAGFLAAVMTDPDLAGIKETLGLGEDSVVLLFSTEGATDRANYDRIVRGQGK